MLPNTFKELADLFANGATIDVECLERIEDLEDYADKGMRLTITGIRVSHDDVAVLQVSYAKYREHNTAFEKRNYYDKDGQPTLNAHEAGVYREQDSMYVGASDDPNQFFISIDDQSNRWIMLYLEQRNEGETYVSFLERVLNQASKYMELTHD